VAGVWALSGVPSRCSHSGLLLLMPALANEPGLRRCALMDSDGSNWALHVSSTRVRLRPAAANGTSASRVCIGVASLVVPTLSAYPKSRCVRPRTPARHRLIQGLATRGASRREHAGVPSGVPGGRRDGRELGSLHAENGEVGRVRRYSRSCSFRERGDSIGFSGSRLCGCGIDILRQRHLSQVLVCIRFGSNGHDD